MDFKIGDDFEFEDRSKKKSMSNGMKIFIVITVSLIAGVSVYFITNYFFGKETEKPITSEVVSLSDPSVEQAYSYVTYKQQGQRYDKFVKEQSVTLNSFTNEEKFKYAFMFSSKEDFSISGKKDANNNDIYSISNSKVNSYMKKFFGDNVTYSTASSLELLLDYRLGNSGNSSNNIVLNYDTNSDSFLAILNGVKSVDTEFIDPFIGSLTKATKRADGTLELQERVIYTSLIENGEDNYTLNIYKDYNKTNLLESKTNLTEEDLSDETIDISNYLQTASLITYTFNKGTDGNYYFVSSNIKS